MPLSTTIAASAIVPTPKETSAAGRLPVDLAQAGVDRRLQGDQAAGAGGEQDRQAPYPWPRAIRRVIFVSIMC